MGEAPAIEVATRLHFSPAIPLMQTDSVTCFQGLVGVTTIFVFTVSVGWVCFGLQRRRRNT